MSALGNLRLANRSGMIAALGPVVQLWGQSNANQCGNNTGPAPLVKTAGGVLYVGGVLQANYSATNHGCEVGFIDECINVLGMPAVTLLRHGVDGVAMSAINTTHAPAFIGHWNSLTLRPVATWVIQGEAEAATSEAAVNGWADALENVLGKTRNAGGGAQGLLIQRIRTTDAVNYAHHALMRTVQNQVATAFPHVGLIHVDDMPLATDGSGTVHFTSATAIESGRRAARALRAAGII